MTVEVLDTGTGELVPTFGRSMLTPDQTRARAQWVRDVTKAALTEGVDYGRIPGTGDKPTLLKPGAEMLILAAGLGFEMDKVDDAEARAHHGVTYTCTIKRAGDFTVAQCDGYAGYDEFRFYVGADEAERRERANAAQYKRAARPERFVEYRAPWNTLVKMAQKRALVGAALNATAASGLFIADLDDPAEDTGGDHDTGAGGQRASAGPKRSRTRASTQPAAASPRLRASSYKPGWPTCPRASARPSKSGAPGKTCPGRPTGRP